MITNEIWNSIVRTVIRLGYKARLKGIIQFSAGTMDLSLLHSIQTGSGAHSASYSMVPRAPSPGIQQVELRMSRAVPPFSYTPLWCVLKTALPLPYDTITDIGI
jgi:hypothetical protein